MVPAQAFAPNYCTVKAVPGILTGVHPVSWHVAFSAPVRQPPRPMPKMLGGIFFLGSEISWNHQMDELFPPAGFVPPTELHADSWPRKG